jgi:thioredoxin reductase (NADPH)
VENIIIIGSGPAGYTASLYAARASLEPVLFEGLESGGQLMLTTDVENYPGFKDGIMGPSLMQEFKEQAERFGTRIFPLTVSSLKKVSKGFEVETNKDTYKARSIIISSGASAKWLGVKGEKELQGYGVSACATCDGFFFKDKVVSVVGGGDSAMEEALFLTKFAKKVFLIHRRKEFRASKIMQDRVVENKKIEIVWNKQVKEITGEKNVKSAVLVDSDTQENEEIDVDAVFVAIGHTPNVGFLDGIVELDSKGYIKTGYTTATSTSQDGIFAAGDVADSVYRQAVTAAGTGCQAAMDAERWLDD